MRRVSVLLCRFRLGGEIMERLTKTYSDGTHGANDNLPCGENSYTYKGLLLEALGKYEDAEEQGLLLRLPCKVGTTVYNTTWWDDVTEKVKVGGKTFYRTVHKHKVSKSTFSLLDIYDFGKTVFLTKEEAENKLKEMESDSV